MNLFKIIKYQLYLLQLENYSLGRYFRGVLRNPFPSRIPPRKALAWTPKLVVLFSLAIVLQFTSSILVARGIGVAILFALFFLVHYVFLIFASLVLWPFDYAVKSYLIRFAKRKIGQLTHDRGLVVIGITGSYGKTTMKEVSATVLQEKFKVLKTPESVNTPVGVARLILRELRSQTQVLIVEMGAYQRGDIKKLCHLATPDIAVLTGINEAHLERFGSLENTVAAKFEIVENAAKGALVILNKDDERLVTNYSKYVDKRKVEFYSAKDSSFASASQIPLLGEYAKGVVNAAVIIAHYLGLTDTQIGQGISQLKPIPHRLELIKTTNGISVIDDSYNGNPDGAREAIKVLGKFEGKRKIYLTPGLVEMGQRSKAVHQEIGEQLARVTDLVILIKNSVTPFIAEGLVEAGFPKDQIIWFESAPEAHQKFGTLLERGDVVLFQNDWPDNYF